MFRDNTQILKIDGKDQLVDIRAAFNMKYQKGGKEVTADKICFQFRKYDKSKAKGDRITQSIDAFMDIDEFAYFCHIMQDYRIDKMLKLEAQKNEAFKASGAIDKYGNPQKAPSSYEIFGGSTVNGECFSKRIKLEKGDTYPVILKGIISPGKKMSNGAIQPDYSRAKETRYISIGLTAKQCMILGLAGERAISIYDKWTYEGTI